MNHPTPFAIYDTPPGEAGRIRTYTGILVDPWNLTPAEIRIEDIAHALSNLCRFTGHVSEFYSVAQHCLLVASYFNDPTFKLAALLHDASEAYFNDLAGPTKCRPELQAYKQGEKLAEKAIQLRFGIPQDAELHKAIKAVDNEVYYWEKASFMRSCDGFDIEWIPNRILAMQPHSAKANYLSEFRELYKGE